MALISRDGQVYWRPDPTEADVNDLLWRLTTPDLELELPEPVPQPVETPRLREPLPPITDEEPPSPSAGPQRSGPTPLPPATPTPPVDEPDAIQGREVGDIDIGRGDEETWRGLAQILTPPDTSYGSALHYGLDKMTNNLGSTLRHMGMERGGKLLADLLEENLHYKPAQPIKDGRLDFRGAANAILEDLPSTAATAALVMVPGAGVPLAVGFNAAQNFGEIMDKRLASGRQADLNDYAVGVVSAGLGGMADVGLGKTGRYIGKLAGRAPALAKPVTSGATGAIRQAVEGAVDGAVKSITDQAGKTFLTEKGLGIDPADVATGAAKGVINGRIGDNIETLARRGLGSPSPNPPRVAEKSAAPASPQVPPDRDVIIGQALSLATSRRALEKIQDLERGEVERPGDPSDDMARRALLLRAGHDALSGTHRPPVALHGSVWSGDEADQPPPLTRRQLDDLLTQEQRRRYFGG